ncbi:hypothetical protein STEG23_010527 [Scotinomys teguina]
MSSVLSFLNNICSQPTVPSVGTEGMTSLDPGCSRSARQRRALLASKMDRESTEEADSEFTSISLTDDADHSSKSAHSRADSLLPKMMSADMDAVDAENQVELEEKTRLINQVLELQHTLEEIQIDHGFVFVFYLPSIKLMQHQHCLLTFNAIKYCVLFGAQNEEQLLI